MRAPNNVDYQPFDCNRCPMAFRNGAHAEWHEWQAHGVPVPEPWGVKTVTAYRILPGSIVINQRNRNIRHELIKIDQRSHSYDFHLRNLGTDEIEIQTVARTHLTTTKFEIED